LDLKQIEFVDFRKISFAGELKVMLIFGIELRDQANQYFKPH